MKMWKDIRENVIHTGCPVSNYESCEKWKPCRIREKNRKWLYDTLCNNSQRLSSISFIRLNSSSRLILKSLFPKKKKNSPSKNTHLQTFPNEERTPRKQQNPRASDANEIFPILHFFKYDTFCSHDAINTASKHHLAACG